MSDKKMKVILVLLILMFLGCLGYMALPIYEYYEADSEYQIISESYVTPDTVSHDGQSMVSDISFDADMIISSDANIEEYVNSIPDIDIDIDGLIDRNSDFVCWLYYEDGKVNYPVVKEHEDDIDGYLHRTFDGKHNSSGCIFIPYDASSNFDDMNTFLYGHNMKNGTMFGSLKTVFRSPSKKFKNPYFYVWTKDHECIVYRIVSMYLVDKNSNMFAVPSGLTAYKEYLSMALDISSTNMLIPFTEIEKQAMDNGSPMVTFSVCYGAAGTSNRLLIHGVEVLREAY